MGTKDSHATHHEASRLLYYVPGNASIIVHIILEELGLPYSLKLLDRECGEDRSAEYLKLNPNGFVPVLVEGKLVLHETAAICLHLIERADSPLVPAPGSDQRSVFYKWLMWLTNTLQPTMKNVFYPQRWARDEAGTAIIREIAEERAGPLLDILENQLKVSGPWLLGEQYTAIDPYAMVICRWTKRFQHPAHERPLLRAHMERVLARPAVIRVFEQENLAKPWL